MPNPLIRRRLSLSSKSLDPDAVLFFTFWIVQPPVSYKQKISKLIKSLKADGNWSLLDRLWIRAAYNQQGANISLVNPSSSQSTTTTSPGWVQFQGYTGDGASSYVNTLFTPSTQGVNFTQNNSCQFFYSRTESQENSLMGGAGAANLHGTHMNIRTVSDTIQCRLNATTAVATVANTTSLGLFTTERTSTTNVNYKRNGVLLGSASVLSTGITNVICFEGANNANGVAANFSLRQIAISGYGSASIDAVKFFASTNAYMASIRTNVV